MAASNELQDFYHFVGKQLATEAGARMSPQQALAVWREEQDTLAAIREGLADVETGRTKPARAALREIVGKRGLTVPDK